MCSLKFATTLELSLNTPDVLYAETAKRQTVKQVQVGKNSKTIWAQHSSRRLFANFAKVLMQRNLTLQQQRTSNGRLVLLYNQRLG